MNEPKCIDCKYFRDEMRGSDGYEWICTNPESFNYNDWVDTEDACEEFEEEIW